MKKLLILLSFALTFLVGVTCTQPVEQPAGTGCVMINFSIGEPDTRALGDGNVADGGGIYLDNGVPDLKIFILGGGTVRARYPGNTATLTSSSATSASVMFTGLPENTTYTVYAFANTGDSNLTVADEPDWSTISTMEALNALVFTALTENNPPTVSGRMPLSAKGSLSVDASGNGSVELDLLRALAKVQITFKNLTGSDLTLTNCNASITSINPTQGYVFQPTGDDLVGTCRTLTFGTKTLSDISASEGEASLDPLLVFPSVAEIQDGYRRYLCNISFNVGNDSYPFNNLPVHNKYSEDITSLGRNQFLKIEVRISKGQEISFNFEVANWVERSETVQFD